MRKESMHWLISNQFALVQVDLENVRTISRKCHNGRVFKLFTFVEFKLETISVGQLEGIEGACPLDISALLSDFYHRLIRDLCAARDVESL